MIEPLGVAKPVRMAALEVQRALLPVRAGIMVVAIDYAVAGIGPSAIVADVAAVPLNEQGLPAFRGAGEGNGLVLIH